MDRAATFVEGFASTRCGVSSVPSSPGFPIVERVTYFHSLPLVAAAAARPSGWAQLWRSGAATAILRRAS